MPEQQLADLHLAVVRERERRLHEPDTLTTPAPQAPQTTPPCGDGQATEPAR